MVNYKVYLFRHGKTFFNVRGIFTGWKDSKLAPEGIRNAKKVAEILKKKKFQAAFQTRLSRSKDTLKYVLKFHPECKKIITDDRVIERSYGILEGISHKKLIEEIGKKIVDLKTEGDAIENLSPKEREKVEKFLGEEEYKIIHRGYNIAVPNGESFADVEKRVKEFIIYLKKFIRKNKVNVAISAHGNSIRLFRKIMENSSKDEAVNWFVPYDKVFEYNLKV
ncbi:MAG: histidine phosphatase family protein [Nanoarchaeota archaeon]